MPKTYEYNGEIFTHEDMLEAYGDDAGVQNAIKQFGIKEQGSDQEDIPVVPGKKKTVAAKGAVVAGQKNGASKKVTGSSASLIPGVNDFGAQLTSKAQGFKEYGQSAEFKKQQVEKNKALKNQQVLDQAKMEARNAASSERLRKKSEAHSRFLEYTKPKEEQLSQLELEIKSELGKDGQDKEYMVYPKNEFQAPYAVKSKYKAFSTEKAEVIAELKKSQTLDKYNEDAIRKLAVEKYRKKKITSIYDTNAKDFMEDATEEEQAELKKASEEASINAAKQVNYKALLNQRFDRNVKAAIPRLQEAQDDLKQYTKDYKFKSKEEYEEYKSKFNYFNDLRNTVIGLQSAQEENLKSLDKSQEDLQTAEQEFDVFKRHYGAGNLVLKPAAAFKSLFAQGLGFASLVADFSSMPARYLYSKTIGDDDFEYVSDVTKGIARYNQYSEDFWDNYFQKTVEITNAESLGEYSFDLLANQLPNLTLMVLSGGGSAAARTVAAEVVGKTVVEQTAKSTLKKAASWTMNKMALDPGLQLMAAGSAGGKYLENVRSNDIGETNYNPIQMVASSLLWGYAEALGEKVTVDILKGSGRTLDALLKGDTNFVQKTLKQRSIDFFKDKGVDFLNENVSEQATNLIQNSVNKFILGQNVGLLDNTGQVFKDTALLTGMLQSAPHIIGAAVKPFLPKDETLTIKDNALKIAKYMNLLKDNSLSFEESTVIEKKIKDLTDNSSEIMKGLIKRIGDMPPSDYDKVINLSKELADLKMQATEIYNSDSSNKEQLIKDLKETHDSKKRELNKLVQETKILSKLDGNYTVQEKRDLYDLEVKAKNLEREIEGKNGAEVLTKKEELKQIREKQNNIALNSMITTQVKGVSAINEILKNKGLSGIEVTNVNTVEEAIEQHDKLLAKLVEAGELTEAKAKAQKATFLKTIKSAEAVNANVNGTDYIYNIKERIDNESVFAHEPGHSIFDRLVSKNPEDYKEIHDALLDHVKTIFGKSTRQNEKNALEYILAGVKAYQQHAIDTKQDYAYDELLQVVGDALQKYNIGMESMDPTFLQRLGEKIKEFLRKVLKIQNVDDIVKFDTGKDVYDFIKEYRRTFRKGELSKGVKVALEKGSIEGKLVKKQKATQKVVEQTKPKLEIKSKNPIELKRKIQILKDFTDNRLPSLLLGKETGDKADAVLLNKIKGFLTISKNTLKYSGIDTSELENYIFDIAKSVRDQEFTTKEIQTKLAEDFELDLSKNRLDAISEQDIKGKIEEILEEDKTRKDKQFEDLSEDDIRNLAIEMVSAEKVFTSSYVLKKGSRRGKKMEQSQFNQEIKMFKSDLNRLAYLLGERFHKTDILKKIAIGSGGIFDATSYDEFSNKFKFKKVINDKRLKSIEAYKAVGIEPMKNNIGKVISDFFDKRQKINSGDIDMASRRAAIKEFGTDTQKTLSDFTGEQRVALDKRIQEIADELTKKRQVDTNASIDLTLAEKVELGNSIKETLSKVLNKNNEDSIKDAGAYFFETLFNQYLESEDKLGYLRFISTMMSLMSSNGTAISRQLAFPRFFSITPGYFIKTSKRTGKQSVQQFHYEHPLKSITFLSNMLDAIKHSSSMEEFKSRYDELIKNYHGFVMNKNDQQIFDADGYTTYSPEFKGNELPISDYSYKVGKDYDVLYIEPSGRVVSLDDFYKTEMFKKEINESINDAISNTVKPSLRIVSDYIQENQPRKIPTNIALDLLGELHRGVENYWGKVSDENVGVMYQNIEYATEIVNEREEDKNPFMKAVNEGLNLATIKDTERRLNDVISDVSVKASLSFNKLVLQDEKRELIKINTDIASKYKSGQTKSEEDQTTINNNIARVREINDFLNKPEGEAVKGVSEKNQKISERNSALMKIFKDPDVDERTKEKVKMDLLANNMGLIYNLSKRYWDYQQDETAFTQDDLKEELILQFFELIRTYNPEKNDNFGAYLNGILPRRIPRILENIGTVKTKAGQERAFGNQLSDEGAKQLTSEEEEDLHDKVAKRRVDLTEAMGMEPSTVKDIETKLIRILNSKIPNVNSKEFKQYMQREIRLEITAILRREFGIKTDYAYYINKYWKVLYDALPISVMNKRFQEFTEPVLDNYGRQEFVQIKEDGKSWRNGVTRKKDIDKAYFYGYFLGQYVGLTTRSTRKTALIDTIAEEISFDMTMDLFANNEEFKSKFEEKQEFLGNELAPNYLSEIAKQLDRDTPTTKASLWAKNWLKDNGLFASQGISILNQMADISRRANAYDSLITKLIDKNPKFKEFIEYFSEKIKSYLTKAKIVLMEKVARMSNKELLLSSTAFSKEQVSKMSNTKIIDELNKLDKDLNESRVKASFGQWAFMDLSSRFNSILEQRTGIPAGEKYSPATAYVKGRGKGKFRFFLPPDAEDFSGLLYSFLPFGENGQRAWNFFQDNLIQPFSSAINNYDKEKMQMIRDYKELKSASGIKNSTLRSTIYSTNYTVDQAIRLYLWSRQGEDIKMIPKNELEIVVEFVRARPELKEYAEQLAKITKRKLGYVPYNNSWLGGTISTDIIDYMNGERREFHLEIWQSHVDEIFSPENLDKVQAIYGLNFRNALESSLHRMKTGRNINNKSDAKSNRWLEWINGANANIMFLNTRSALLQLTATINYIDMEINNPVAAAKAFANQPQFWKDFVMLWNEDYLLDRRGGLRFDVAADDIATAASGKNGFKKLIAKISEAGFAPTKYADSISATLGGASFYRNHYNHYLNIGYTEEEAHDQAISDWSERTETTNQSARPDKVSQIQSTNIGRLVFAFGNTSMQYNRLMKRAFLDIINKRGDWKKNAAKIIYYGAINNMIFSFLQNALFASIFGDDDDEQDKSIYEDQALASTVDGILDSLLKGSGMYGAIASTAKNMWQKWYEMELSGRKNPFEVPLEILSISPAMSSKMNKLVSAGRTFIYKQEIEKSKQAGWSLDNPAYGSAAKVFSVVYNVPADRIFQKIENLRLASDSSLETWQRTMLLLGYNKYNLGIEEKLEPIDVLSKSDRKTFETYKDVEPTLTEEQYMEMKDLEPKVRPGRKNKKTWLNIFNPRLKQEMAKDPLTKAQRKTFEKYKAIEPTLTVKDFIDMNNISIREGSNVEEFEKISQELEERKAQEEEILNMNVKNKEE